MNNINFPVLIGDIGGTNARFAIVHDMHGELELFEPVKTAEFQDLQSAIKACVLSKTATVPRQLLVGIAGPITGEQYHLTNADIVIRPQEIIKDLGMTSAEFMNDFPAQALGVLAIDRNTMDKVGGGDYQPNGTRIVLGPGTSFGIATIVETKSGLTILPAEGACADLGLGSGLNAQRELKIQQHLKKLHARQTIETMLCGPGLENLYQAIYQLDNLNAGDLPSLSAAEISKAAKNSDDAGAKQAVELFGALLGRVAGNLAMSVLAFGGIYVSGGMATKMLDQIKESSFRREFENKAPHSALAKMIPTYFVNRELAALEGLAAYVRDPETYGLEHVIARFRSVEIDLQRK